MTDLERLAEGSRAIGVGLTTAQLEQYRAYIAGLSEWNERFNLVSGRALEDAERTLVLDSLTLVPIILREHGARARLIDVGSGAGFPGLALKVAMPRLHVVLVEATRKKTEFLDWVVDELALELVEIVADRAEGLAHHPRYRETFDVATARALGPLPVVMELTLPFCRTGGVMLSPRGPHAETEAVAARGIARRLGGRFREVEAVAGDRAGRSAVVLVDKVRPTPDEFPRRAGMPAKRPLETPRRGRTRA